MSGYTGGLQPYVSGGVEWLYPSEDEPPRGRKIHILQEGGVSIQGVWADGEGYLGWQRMFTRNHEKEEAYKALVSNSRK